MRIFDVRAGPSCSSFGKDGSKKYSCEPAHDLDVAMRLHARRHGPLDGGGIEGIDVVIDDRHLFDVTPGRRAEYRQSDHLAVALVELVDGHHHVKDAAAALGEMDRFDASQSDVAEYFRLFPDRREHIGLMRRRALIGEMENRTLAPRERGQVNRWAGHLQAAVVAGELAERVLLRVFHPA